MTTQIEIKPSQRVHDAVMADCGTQYFTTFNYRVEGDSELYGDDVWRRGKIIWTTTDAWRAEEERVRGELEENPYARVDTGLLDDESMACDWNEYEIQDDIGEVITGSAAKEVAALLP